ncbi:hypothetical protein HZS_995, partial [Henneguya salminicola]
YIYEEEFVSFKSEINYLSFIVRLKYKSLHNHSIIVWKKINFSLIICALFTYENTALPTPAESMRGCTVLALKSK